MGLLLASVVLVIAAYFWPIPILILVAAIVLVVIAWARPFYVFAGLLLLLPFHEQVVRFTTWQLQWPSGRVTMLSLWKELIIGLLFAVLLIQHISGKHRMRWKVYYIDLWLLALFLLSGAYVLMAPELGIGIFGLRNYLEPLALLFLARLLPYSRQDLKNLLVALAAVAAVVAAFGIYQAEFIDFPTMISMGYVDEGGRLPFAFKTALQDFTPRPRAISTVTGPNQLAIYLQFFLFLAAFALVYGRKPGRRPLLIGLLLLYTICWLLTFSRGGLLAMGSSLVTWGLIVLYDRGIKRTWRELRRNPLFLGGLIALAGLATVGLVVTGFVRRIVRGITGQDPAALGHVNSLVEATNFIVENPLGMGIGMVGPRARRFMEEFQIGHAESTYLQFGMETGVLGMILLLITLFSLVATLWRLREKKRGREDLLAQRLTELFFIIWVGALTVFVVTPLLQNMLVASYLWLLVGFALHLDAYSPDLDKPEPNPATNYTNSPNSRI
jgi:hypothetical protein